MPRLGKFTGSIYNDESDFSICPECCRIITDDQALDEEFINRTHMDDLKDCARCFGCPASQGSRCR